MIKGIVVTCALVFVLGTPFSSAGAATRPDELAIVQDGKAVATIVTAEKPTYWETVAAGWVQTYVERSCGAKLPIVPESKAPAGTLISIGHTTMARDAGIKTDDLEHDGCKMVVKGKILYLIGRDTPGITPKATGYDGGAKGTCRAATKFLEDIVGVRWFLPTPGGEHIPETRDVAVPANLDVAFSPAFAFTSGRFIYGTATPAGIANNYRNPIKMKSYGGHSYYPWVPEQEYFDEHPEYFWMDESGNRQKAYGHLCTSNPDVRALFKKNLFEQFEKGYDWVELAQTDGYRRCQCPLCEAMDNYGDLEDGKVRIPEGVSTEDYYNLVKDYPPERLHLAHKWLIDEAKEHYPDKKVHLIVYGPTTIPSKKFDYYGDNVVLEICENANPAIIRIWKSKAAGFTVYIYWFDICYGDIDAGMSPSRMAQVIRDLHAAGCIGIYFGGGGEGNWGFIGPTYYVLGKMMGDPNLDEKALVAEYCEGMYGKASREMQDFFELLSSRLHMARERKTGIYGEDKHLMRYPPRFLLALDELLARAELKADTERSRSLIRMTRDQFEFNKRIAVAIVAYRSWKMNRTTANWKEIEKAVDAFNEFRERVTHYDEDFVAKYYPGWGKFCGYLTSDASKDVYWSKWRERRKAVLSKPLKGLAVGYSNAIRRPLTLDFSRPPELGTMKVHRVATPPKLDGKLDDRAWKRADAQILAPMQIHRENLPTTVRLVYDDANLYIAFECEEPLMEHLVARSAGRDGPIWRMDCGEILLAPDRSRRRYYHYIMAPAKDALYDNRTGYKTMDDEDESWDGPCEYAFFVDGENKRWFLEAKIPFATLDAETPRPGEWWLGNFGRERQAQRKGKYGQPALFLWSQNELLGFVDPTAFGKIVFVE